MEDEVYQLDIASPTSSYIGPASTSTGWQLDARYRLLQTYDAYDRGDNPTQVTRRADRPTSYLWSNGEEQLLAEARNASSAQIAYTSFEPGATGRWQYDSLGTRQVPVHFTGNVSYQLDGTLASTIRRPGLAAGEYELWFWSYGPNVPLVSLATGTVTQRDELLTVAGPWQQHHIRLTLPANATLQLNSVANQSIWIDELRLYPVGAQMTTYTHQPLAGITSQTDPSGRTTTYEYDALGRLIRTRDEQGRVLSQQHYHYARRP